MSTLVQVRFLPEVIYFISVQVQIISHELNSSHFPIFKIFVNNLVPRSHWTPITPKNMKIQLSRNLKKIVWVIRFRERNPTVNSISSSEIYKISRFCNLYYYNNLLFCPFLEKIQFFSGFIVHVYKKTSEKCV